MQDTLDFSQQVKDLARQSRVSFISTANEYVVTKETAAPITTGMFDQVPLSANQESDASLFKSHMEQLESLVRQRITHPRYQAMVITELEKLHMLISKGISRSGT